MLGKTDELMQLPKEELVKRLMEAEATRNVRELWPTAQRLIVWVLFIAVLCVLKRADTQMVLVPVLMVVRELTELVKNLQALHGVSFVDALRRGWRSLMAPRAASGGRPDRP
ncbi:hypothetical protein GPECTOR_13g637 [Gonium pectorale]|uniref:Uncharacterized protein n=1 Tax=Gonium pectorale TaxID=33097 RepID=A0A150GP98_GONPE|nr:hypothetical protein GPECTOR_13g637 [Gonium pectorale]|eukprot:KXZ51150.1 hypothetical protein GPECTOR_13g637 [Gonium pectorale]